MTYRVKILADSRNELGDRLTTFELTYPRFVHAQLMTHRLFSRNAASSRAIPTRKLIERVEMDPVMPVEWGKNQKGMQASEVLPDEKRAEAEQVWLGAMECAVHYARKMLDLGVHKQIANRLIEPWMFITVIVSATEFDNWYHLRDGDAQPEIAWVAKSMKLMADRSTPRLLRAGEWHLPLVELEDNNSPLYIRSWELDKFDCDRPLAAISTARCARVSYLTHDGQRDLKADIGLHDRLLKSGHWSPFEHVAMSTASNHRYGNFFGFKQYRKFFQTEHHGKEMD